jgi:hypothetical protein
LHRRLRGPCSWSGRFWRRQKPLVRTGIRTPDQSDSKVKQSSWAADVIYRCGSPISRRAAVVAKAKEDEFCGFRNGVTDDAMLALSNAQQLH